MEPMKNVGILVERKNLKQWMLRIPLYAERLLDGLEDVDWPEGVKDMQRNWIGRSTGAEVDFQVEGINEILCGYLPPVPIPCLGPPTWWLLLSIPC